MEEVAVLSKVNIYFEFLHNSDPPYHLDVADQSAGVVMLRTDWATSVHGNILKHLISPNDFDFLTRKIVDTLCQIGLQVAGN